MSDFTQHDARNGHHEFGDEPDVVEQVTAAEVVESAPVDGKDPHLSVVVPTRNEAGNIAALVARLEKVLPHLEMEIIFVDDSDDETPEVIRLVARTASRDVILVHRKPGERDGGLGGAVIAGFQTARAPWLCVMDGDLQHPPELIADMVQQARQKNADLVVASRHRDEGRSDGLNLVRMAISQASDTMARLMFPTQLQDVSDPMSGFFLIRKAVLDLETLQPKGFKILLEIMVRTRRLRVAEVPFHFGERYAGESKANLREGVRFLSLLWHLRFGEDTLRFLRFGLVGASGLVVNTVVLAFFTSFVGIHYLASAVLATQSSTLWNFGFTEFWVFADRQQRWGRIHRLIMFVVMNTAALGLRGPLMFTLTSGLGIHYLVSNLISLVALMFLRFALSNTWIWGRAPVSETSGDGYGLPAAGI